MAIRIIIKMIEFATLNETSSRLAADCRVSSEIWPERFAEQWERKRTTLHERIKTIEPLQKLDRHHDRSWQQG